jgi:glycosyltransferase involved in cell wall biosynthesis
MGIAACGQRSDQLPHDPATARRHLGGGTSVDPDGERRSHPLSLPRTGPATEPATTVPRVHVGLNLVFLTPGEQGGMETYTRELIPELVAAAPEHRFTCFVNRDAAEADGPWQGVTGSVVVPVSARSRVEWVRGEQLLLPPLARRAGVELLHSFASTAPAWGPFRRVVTIHDLIYRTLPEAHPGVRALGMRVLVPLAAHRSARVIADSEATAADVRRFLHVAAARVDVVALGVGAGARAAALPESDARALVGAGARPIVVSVSAKLAHKNLLRLIGAVASIPTAQRPLLVLPGYPTPHEAQLREHAAGLGVTEDVCFLGWVSAPELEGLYAAASAVVLPTLAEGFGLPVLEAMARGVPVACSDIPVLREVAGEDALFFNPRSETAIAQAITRLLGDGGLAERLRATGPVRAARFSWRRTAEHTLDAYRRAAG